MNVVPKTGRQLVASDFVVGFDGGFYGYASLVCACIMCIVRILSIQIPGKSRVIFGVTPTPGPLPPLG